MDSKVVDSSSPPKEAAAPHGSTVNNPTATNGNKTADPTEKEEAMDVDEMPKASAGVSQASTSQEDLKKQQQTPLKYSCGKCKYTTRNKVLFDNHTCDNQDEDNDLEEQTLITLTMDSGKKYHCSECDVSAQGHAFEEHLMCHIILRPYQCLYCSQCFVNRREIGRHVVKTHAGKKMNCALRALKRARGLMKAASETGTYEFYARVAGKVPLSSDPDKDKDKVKTKKPKGESSEEAPRVSKALSTSSSSETKTSDMTKLSGEDLSSFKSDTSSQSEKDSDKLHGQSEPAKGDLKQDRAESKDKMESKSKEEEECKDKGEEKPKPKDEDEAGCKGKEEVDSGDKSEGKSEGTKDGAATDTGITAHHNNAAQPAKQPAVLNGSVSPATEQSSESVSKAKESSDPPTEASTKESSDPPAELSTKESSDPPAEASTKESSDPPAEASTKESSDPPSEASKKSESPTEAADSSAEEPDSVSDMPKETVCILQESGSDNYEGDQHVPEEAEKTEVETTKTSSKSAEDDEKLQTPDSEPHECQSAEKQLSKAEGEEKMETEESVQEKMDTEELEKPDKAESNHSDSSKLSGESVQEKMEIGELEKTDIEESNHSDSSKPIIVQDGADEDAKVTNKTKDTESLSSNFDQSDEEEGSVGLKIVATFSLQNDDTKESNSNDSETGSQKAAAAAEQSGKEPAAETTTKPETQEASSAPTQSDNSRKPTAPRTLGPPSKPVPSSSFLGLSPTSESAVSQAGRSPQRHCHFFICGFGCPFSCLTSPEFRDHLMLDHAGETAFSCYHCGFQSHSEDGLVRHISAHAHTYSKSAPLYICGASACKFGSNLVADFITHQASWHPDLTTFHCHDCDERFQSVDDILKHFEANFLHIINCPHCTAKATERRTLLNHIATVHPGKPKMVSVAKQIVCRDRKLNDYVNFQQLRNQPIIVETVDSPPLIMIDTEPGQESNQDQSGTGSSKNKSLVSILTEPIQPQERELTRQAAATPQNATVVKCETFDEEEDDMEEDFEDSFDEEEYLRKSQGQGGGEIAYMGSKPDEREVDNFKCKYCTFIARDRCRLEGHERCHGLPPSRKSRFKCMYCPQGFNNEHKFNSHVSCHPGLIKFSLFCCKRCEFDSNQRHIIIKHVRSTRDQAHMSYGSNEEDMFATLHKTMETRVLECTQCNYMTRHRKHLVHHIKRDHSSPRKTGITVDCDIVEKYPNQSLGANRSKALEMAVNHDRAAPLPVGDDGNVRENQARRFKCPICQYLVPRAADLKAHVKRHSEIGEITLVMFRCKYCSAASTAREIIYGHLMEKHLGKQIALVKRIVTIDTRGGDNGYAVTSMEDEEDGQMETQSFPQVPGGGSSGGADKMVLLIPDSAGETFQTLMQCPCCAFASYNRKTIIQHVANHHPEVNIMGRRQDNEVYPLDTSFATSSAGSSSSTTSDSASAAAAARITLGEALKGEILIVPDSQTFDEAVLCPKCEYATIHRRNIVQHLEQNHPGVSVMGRNDYPTFEGKGQDAVQANATGKDGMVIIGSGSLDEKIRCLYENYGDRMKCMICQTERPKKFFIHVHILRHLNILLWGCQFCSHRGLQKYKMMDHIKKVHPGRAFCIRYLPVNVEEKVNEYLQNASAIRARRSGEDDTPSPTKGSGDWPSPNSEGDLNAMRMKYKASQDKLSSCTIGSEELDMQLACLYSVGEDSKYRCVVCAQEFQRKFAVHRHIVQAHLKVNLIGCGYCDLEGVERHIMMDHIIETHKSAPISMRNLARNLENKVAEFLSRMTLDADAALELPGSDIGMDEDFNFKLPEPPQLPSMLPPLEVASPRRTTPPRTPSPSTSSSSTHKNQLNPKLLLLGRDTLHVHLKCLIDESAGGLRCVVCNWDFPRKYAAHRHILMKHLKLGIIGCPYCTFEGVERYQVFTHIKEDHKDSELSLRYLNVDLESIVGEFMKNLANGTVNLNDRTPPPWSMKKLPKREVFADEDSNEASTSNNSESSEGLVVAMFGKKSSTVTVKEEPADEDDAFGQEPNDREVNGDDENSSNIDYDSYVGVMDEADREVRSMSLQAANGTKAKVATDVQTNIRVITITEKGFKRHICEKCKFTSLHRSNIVRHIYRVHEQYREQECPACNYKTLSRVLIEQHIQNEHPGTPFPQGLPNRMFKRKPDMSLEDLEYDSMKKCKAAATSKRREADLPLLNSTSTQLYACAYCNFETMTHKDIVQHTRENHTPGDPMKADGAEGEGGADDEEGVEDNAGVRGQDGDDTEFETLTTTVKMNQVDLSKGPEDSLWQCFYCSYKTSNEDDLKVHFSDAHPGNVYRSKKIPTWRFVCRSCHVKTRAHSKMRYHLNRHINYRPYTCTTCGSFYPSPDQCRKHCRANNHNETFTYVKIPRKEKRLQQLLKECQEIAMALTRNPGEAKAMTDRPDLAMAIPSKRKAKKSFSPASRFMLPSAAKMRKNYEYDAPYSPRVRGEEKEKEPEAQMVCASCDFTASNVCDVWLHFIKEHEQQEFMWMDAGTGHICNETGEITNAKDVPPDLEAPPGPGYSTLSNRMLSCHSCEFTTSTVQAMKSHLRRHLPKRYLCPYCSLRCSRRDTITQHVRCGHKGRELWTIFFRLPDGFVPDDSEAAADLDEPQVTFQTEDIAMDVSQPQVKAPVSVSERIKCAHCDMKMESVASIHEHHIHDHPELEFLWVDSTNGYTCNQTGEVTDAREQSPHLFSQDGFDVESSSGNVPTFCCKFCPFTSAFIQAIKSHMKSHLPHGFMCPFCCMCTNSKEKMISHQSCTHREQEPWVLHLRMPTDASTAAANLEKSLPPVIRRPPTGITTYSCSECDYSSENLYQYRLHLANHGTFPHLVKDIPEDLPFKCGYCVYVAEDEGDFGAHIASHLERRNFRCSKCEYTSFTRSAVQSHIQSTHDETDEIEVIDLHAENVSDNGGSMEDPRLVNLDPKLKVVPVDDLDLDREGLTLFTPPSTPEDEEEGGSGGGDEHGGEEQVESEGFKVDSDDVGIIGLGMPTASDLELDNQSDSTEEWGTNADEEEEEEQEQSTPAPSSSGGSILRLTLQGKLTGEYGIKRAVPADLDSDASASRDSVAYAPTGQAEDEETETVGVEPGDEEAERPGDEVDGGVEGDVSDDDEVIGLDIQEDGEDEEEAMEEDLNQEVSKDNDEEDEVGSVFSNLSQ